MGNGLTILGYVVWQPVLPVVPFLFLALIAILALVVAIRHIRAVVGRRVALLLGVVRGLVIALLLAALAQPMVHIRSGGNEQRTLLALVDVSASMALPCAGGESRLERACRLLAEVRATVPEDWRWEVRPFSNRLASAVTRVSELAAEAGTVPASTDIPAALAEAMELARRGGMAAVLLLSDGGDDVDGMAVPASVPLVATLAADDTRPYPDAAVASLTAPEVVERETTFNLAARIEVQGEPSFLHQAKELTVRVLRQTAAGTFAPFDTVVVDASSGVGEIAFEVRCAEAGQEVFQVEVPLLTREPIGLNNRRSIAVNVRQSTIDLLFYARQIGADLKFLRQELGSDPAIRFTALYQTGAGRYTVQGDAGSDSSLQNGFPVESADLQRFDCIIVGSFPAEAWATAEMGALLAYVEAGGGLIWLGGDDSFDGGGYIVSPLRPLIPWQAPGHGGSSLVRGTFPPVVTPVVAAATAGLIEMLRGATVPEMRGLELASLNRPQGLRPGAQVLLTASADGSAAPLVVEHRYGKGRVFAVASNTTWIWARTAGVPGRFYQHFWRQTVRAAANQGESGTYLTAVWNRNTYRPGDRVEIDLRGEGGGDLRLRASCVTDGQRTALTVSRDGMADTWQAGWHLQGRQTNIFEAVLETGDKVLETYVRIVPLALPSDEGACLVPDVDAYLGLVEAAGGVWAEGSEAVVAALWEAARPKERLRVIGLAASPWFLIVVAVLMGIDWACRRRFGLL